MKNQNKNQNQTISAQDRLAALNAERAELENQIKLDAEKEANALAARIDELPASFNVTNGLEGMIALIKKRMSNKLGSIAAGATSATRTSLTKEERAAAVQEVKDGKQRSVVADKYNIHPQTLHNYLKEAGVVQARTAPVATPTVETPAAVGSLPGASSEVAAPVAIAA